MASGAASGLALAIATMMRVADFNFWRRPRRHAAGQPPASCHRGRV